MSVCSFLGYRGSRKSCFQNFATLWTPSLSRIIDDYLAPHTPIRSNIDWLFMNLQVGTPWKERSWARMGRAVQRVWTRKVLSWDNPIVQARRVRMGRVKRRLRTWWRKQQVWTGKDTNLGNGSWSWPPRESAGLRAWHVRDTIALCSNYRTASSDGKSGAVRHPEYAGQSLARSKPKVHCKGKALGGRGMG